MFRNTMPRYEVLSQDAMAALDKGWRRLVSEIGVEFVADWALELFRAAGQRVESQVLSRAVRWHAETRVLVNGHRTVVFR